MHVTKTTTIELWASAFLISSRMMGIDAALAFAPTKDCHAEHQD